MRPLSGGRRARGEEDHAHRRHRHRGGPVMLLLLAAAQLMFAAWASASKCAVVPGTVLGARCTRATCTMGNSKCESSADCCDLCGTTKGCTAWTFESTGTCFLKNSTAGSEPRAGAVSGCISAADCPQPPPPAQPQVSVVVDTSTVLSRIDPGFKCWNIDASPNREWETRDLSSPLLASLGRQSLPGYLRFGGSGNDGLAYALDMSDPSSDGNGCAQGSRRCLNRTWTDNLANFARRSGAKLVFGLNVEVCSKPELAQLGRNPCFGQAWDPTEARALMKYLIKANHTVYGFELGNEQNTNYSPRQAAAYFKVLSDLLIELWPKPMTRPKIIGPDVHGFHNDPLTSPPEEPKLRFLKEFAPNCSQLGVPLHAATHHEYIEVDENPTTPPRLSQLTITNQIATAVNDTLTRVAPSVQIWAGEIGPHNGGTVPCDHSMMRWANFADSHWYLDAMGVKAANGYSVFCRQDFVGIDYGMIDCSTYTPLPDYYASILWSKLMGSVVLKATSSDPTLRVYAHCSVGDRGAATVLLINLDPTTQRLVTLHGLMSAVGEHGDTSSGSGSGMLEWHLTGPDGMNATAMALNGKLLVAKVVAGGTEYDLPSLEGQQLPPQVLQAPRPPVVTLDPASIAFVQVATSTGVCNP